MCLCKIIKMCQQKSVFWYSIHHYMALITLISHNVELKQTRKNSELLPSELRLPNKENPIY